MDQATIGKVEVSRIHHEYLWQISVLVSDYELEQITDMNSYIKILSERIATQLRSVIERK